MRPKFSLEYLQRSHCLSLCARDEKAALADRFHELSQLTWQQIHQADRHIDAGINQETYKLSN
jgi:hypothetical protein